MPPTFVAQSARRRAGFTLIEVAAAVLIASIAASLAVAAIPGTGRPSLRALAIEVASLLRRERWGAVVAGATREVRLEPSTRRFIGETGSVAAAPDVVLDILSAEDPDDPSVVVRFYPDGSASGLALNMTRQGVAHEVRVNWLTGAVSIRGATSR